ncbi:trimeric intracellular cation channel family protein [Dermatophilus congolensis]|uniref:Predicted membrane protein n=1 Tax=Dermatophilus congolensis TaxID=1863 RepID=A0A239VPG0_9MICO|nr:TRIC cation channel family protein [Dermatophilus congolensis]MBO3129713.1 hypothetical protein [Dermatophilus congolensis]MBO3131657.1 hypothetical protein [Dermatophilus congolensis]MBO3134187.1 hypothetical protein [Dermatophilus congolensis]MBO3136421.1 hypothetical protein [Dermatophilus congolensis]MBO3138669.1 hypothetical protein [Dermatophilus congolensis]
MDYLLEPERFFRAADVIGIFANALIGGAVARSKGFDIIGFVVLAITTAMAGGILRDVILGTTFPVAVTDPWYMSSAVVAALLAFVLELDGRWKILLAAGDMVALGCWSATGAAKAAAAGLDLLPCIMLGVITAVFGGMFRDVLVNQVPSVFGENPLYASLAVVSAFQMTLMLQAGHYRIGMVISIVGCTVLGLLAQRRNWILPSAASLTLGGLVRVGPNLVRRIDHAEEPAMDIDDLDTGVLPRIDPAATSSDTEQQPPQAKNNDKPGT